MRGVGQVGIARCRVGEIHRKRMRVVTLQTLGAHIGTATDSDDARNFMLQRLKGVENLGSGESAKAVAQFE